MRLKVTHEIAVLDARVVQGAFLAQRGRALVGIAELLVLDGLELRLGTVEDGDVVHGAEDGVVAESAAPRDGVGQRPKKLSRFRPTGR